MKIREVSLRPLLTSIGLSVGSSIVPIDAVASSSDVGTLTASKTSTTTCVNPITHVSGTIYFVGYDSYTSEGSYSPVTLTGGKTVVAVFDTHGTGGCPGVFPTLIVKGFTSDPGASWLVSITCNGVALGAGASYFWEPGVPEAIWEWSTIFGFTNGSQYNCTIVHN